MAWQTYLNNGLHVLMWPVALPHGTIIRSYFLIHFHTGLYTQTFFCIIWELFLTNFSLALPTQWYNTIKEMASNGTPTAFSSTVPRNMTSSRYMKPKPYTHYGQCAMVSWNIRSVFESSFCTEKKNKTFLEFFYSFSKILLNLIYLKRWIAAQPKS